MSKWKTRRCTYFRDDGQPRHLRNGTIGCTTPSPVCPFAHPDDPEWTYAVHSYPPPLTVIFPDPPEDAMPPRRPPSPYGLPPPPPPPRGPPPPPRGLPPRTRVASTSSAGYGAPSRTREDVSPPRSKYGHGRDGSPAPSLASSSGERVRRASYVASGARWREEEREMEGRRYRDDDRYRDERGHVDRSRERDRRREDEREQRRDNASRDRDRRSRSNSRVRRPSSSSLSRRPSDPRDRNDGRPAPPKNLTHEEMRSLWEDRVRLLSQAIEARGELQRLYEDLQTSERLAKSLQYESFSDEDKAAVQNLITTTSSHLQQKQQELNRLVARLVPDDFWPFARREQYHGDPGFNRMTEVVTSLKGKVAVLHEALATAQAAQLPTDTAVDVSVPATKPEPGEITASASVESTTRPKKRRRMSTGEGSQVPGTPAAELDTMLERLAALDHRLSELNNDVLQYDSKIEDEVEAQLDYRMAGLRLGGEGEKLADPDTQKKAEKLAEDVAHVQARAKEAEDELAKLQSRGQDYDEKNAHFQEQNEILRQQIAELQASQAQMLDTVSAQTSEIRALSAAVTAYIARPLNPPLPPGPLTADTIIEAIRPKLIEAARDDLLPILEEVRGHIEKELQEQSTLVTTELRIQMSPLVRSVEWISAWVERIRIHSGSTATTTSTTAASPIAAAASTDKGKGIAR